MMRITLILNDDYGRALQIVSAREVRDLRDQVLFFIRKGLEESGDLLRAEAVRANAQVQPMEGKQDDCASA